MMSKQGRVKEPKPWLEPLGGLAVICGGVAVAIGLVAYLIGGAGWFLSVATTAFLILFIAGSWQLVRNGDGLSGETDEDGYRHGEWTSHAPAGNLLHAVNYQHGTRHGDEQRYYSSGERMSVAQFVEGKLHGPFQAWHPNGQLAHQVTYEEGKRHGPATVLGPDGRREVEAEFSHGEPHGKWTWYGEQRPNGQRQQWVVAQFAHGAAHGHWQEFQLRQAGELTLDDGGHDIDANVATDSAESEPAESEPAALEVEQPVRSALYEHGFEQSRTGESFVDRSQNYSEDATNFTPPIEFPRPRWPAILTILLAVWVLYKEFFVLVPVVGLLLIIGLHEFGHLLAAKLVRIPIRTFRIGVGPRVCQFHWGLTQFQIAAIPLLGYVAAYRMRASQLAWHVNRASTTTADGDNGGKSPESDIDPTEPMVPSVELVHPFKRLLFFLGGIAMNFALAVSILAFVPVATGESSLPAPVKATAQASTTLLAMIQGTPQVLGALFDVRQLVEYRPSVIRLVSQSAKQAVQEPGPDEAQQAELTEEQQQQLRKKWTQDRWRQPLLLLAIINLGLVWFNLLPIPPLDGARCVGAISDWCCGPELRRRMRTPMSIVGVLLVLFLLAVSGLAIVRDLLGVLMN